jgi:hypothetical protein
LCRRENPKENPAMITAIGIDKETKKFGRKNMIVLGYSDFLKEFAHYLQQVFLFNFNFPSCTWNLLEKNLTKLELPIQKDNL